MYTHKYVKCMHTYLRMIHTYVCMYIHTYIHAYTHNKVEYYVCNTAKCHFTDLYIYIYIYIPYGLKLRPVSYKRRVLNSDLGIARYNIIKRIV